MSTSGNTNVPSPADDNSDINTGTKASGATSASDNNKPRADDTQQHSRRSRGWTSEIDMSKLPHWKDIPNTIDWPDVRQFDAMEKRLERLRNTTPSHDEFMKPHLAQMASARAQLKQLEEFPSFAEEAGDEDQDQDKAKIARDVGQKERKGKGKGVVGGQGGGSVEHEDAEADKLSTIMEGSEESGSDGDGGRGRKR